MIKFFRRFRQKLLSENKFGRYVLYALGEIILVVIGILIALQINNWNENRKLKQKKQVLVKNLINDFDSSLRNLETSLRRTDSLIKSMDIFAELINSESDVPVDSLKVLAKSFFMQEPFSSGLSSYKQALNNGDLELLANPKLFAKINRFEERDELQQKVFDNFIQGYSNGYIWDVRKEVGSIYNIYEGSSSSFTGLEYKEIDLEGYKKLILSPTVLAAMQNHRQLSSSRRGDFIWLMQLCKEVIAMLEKEKNE